MQLVYPSFNHQTLIEPEENRDEKQQENRAQRLRQQASAVYNSEMKAIRKGGADREDLCGGTNMEEFFHQSHSVVLKKYCGI